VLKESEIAEERSVEHMDLKVSAPGGAVRVTHVCKTVAMTVWEIKTAHHVLRCAGKHLVIGVNGPTPVDQIRVGSFIKTDAGYAPVLSARNTGTSEELYDLRVDSDDHIYYTGGIASHNSTGLGAAELFKANVLPGYKSLYITPLREQLKTIADKLMDMQRGSIFPPDYVTSRGYKNNLYYKETPAGGSIKLLNILTDVSKVRGNSCPVVCYDECQDLDPDHIHEVAQVQKAYPDSRATIFAGTSKDLDTCLEAQYQIGSQGVWHIPCGCKDKFHALNDVKAIPKMISVHGLRCPNNGTLLNPLLGEFVHADRSKLALNRVSFHLPQVIVPAYSGPAFLDIYNDFKSYPEKKFMMEVMGIAVDAGMAELTETDLKRCCDPDKTFEQLQKDYFSGETRYVKLFSGVDWGGSDWNPATRTKQSYTVHTIYGMRGDGKMVLLYANRYAGMNYQDIAGTIVEAHNEYHTFAMGTDNGGGAYYNAYMRDCGRLPTDKLIHFNYSDTKMFIDRIPHPEANIMSLHRSDSISALISDIKAQNIIFPRWSSCYGFVSDCLNMRRNITEAPSGRSVMRYVRHGSKADDFMQATNYALMMKRITTKEPTIPNKQILDELASMFGTSTVTTTTQQFSDYMDDGIVSG